MVTEVEDENSLYLWRLWSLYRFLFKFFFAHLFFGSLPRKAPGSRLKKLFGNGQIAHRGGDPEHTFIGFRHSVEHDVNVLEVDVTATIDGHLVLFHDFTLERTTDGHGLISEKTLEQLKALNIAGHSNSKIPTVSELMKFAKENDLFLLLDVKGTVDQTVPVLVEMFKKEEWLLQNAAVISFFPDIIYSMKCQCPEVYTGISCCSTEFSHDYSTESQMFKNSLKQAVAHSASRIFYFLVTKWVHQAMGVDIILPSYTDIKTQRFTPKHYTQNGVIVIVWTANTDKTKHHVSEILGLPYLTDCVS